MKNIFILILFVSAWFSSLGYNKRSVHGNRSRILSGPDNAAMKTTALGDTLELSNIPDTATLALYTFDSGGYTRGINYWGDQAFAERYDVGSDTSYQVLGIYALFGGAVNPLSAKRISFNVWDVGIPVVVTDTLAYSGFPNNLLDSISVPVTGLGIGPSVDSGKAYLFATPAGYLSRSFFVGYGINYNYSALNGDTIGLYTSLDGDRTSAKYHLAVNITDNDTTYNIILNVQNATMTSDYNWHDNYYDNDSLFNDLAIYPIVKVGDKTGVQGISRKGLVFYDAYPNPATDEVNIRFSLASSAAITIQLMDISGRALNVKLEEHLTAGEHSLPLSLTGVPVGDYLCLVRSSSGGGIVTKITVVH